MNQRNPKSPWNPAYPPDLSPDEYERQVVAWLRQSRDSLKKFALKHLKHLEGPAGDYEFDAVAEFTVFGGAGIIVIVECKRYSSPVERDHLLALWAKKEDVSAHKAMMFATCGFQSGALKYARRKGIATITFVEGSFLYETKAAGPSAGPPPWVDLPRYAGIMLRSENEKISSSRIDNSNLEPLSEWIAK